MGLRTHEQKLMAQNTSVAFSESIYFDMKRLLTHLLYNMDQSNDCIMYKANLKMKSPHTHTDTQGFILW